MFKKLSKISKLMLVISIVFLIWMSFFDENSFINKNKLNNDIKELNKETKYYKLEISKDTKMMENLNNTDSLEKYAREKYKMKKENEEIFLIEFDSVK
ncbi:MAG: septum formation initiator family protein [Flavobacteriaceae bacterium]|nr:septum formation initiator family protein [Flavobacteriaceae bacterium]